MFSFIIVVIVCWEENYSLGLMGCLLCSLFLSSLQISLFASPFFITKFFYKVRTYPSNAIYLISLIRSLTVNWFWTVARRKKEANVLLGVTRVEEGSANLAWKVFYLFLPHHIVFFHLTLTKRFTVFLVINISLTKLHGVLSCDKLISIL